jgi:hypothetical protein
MKPKYIRPDPDSSEDSVPPQRTNPNNFNYQKGVFELYLDFKKNIPHVVYFDLIEYLVQTFEVKIEFSHFLMLSKFLSTVGQMLNTKLTWIHQVFDDDQSDSDDDTVHSTEDES